MRNWVYPALALSLLLTGCGETAVEAAPDGEVASLEGDALSPNDRFEVRLSGVQEGASSGGLYAPECVQIADVKTGDVLWEDTGYYRQAVLWAPGNLYVAIARSARTYEIVTIVQLGSFASWDVTLAEGEGIPEYTFLPEENWGIWLDGNTLELTVGQGGDSGPQAVYRCAVFTQEDGTLTGSTLEETVEILPETYDFTGAGARETVEVVTVLTPETPGVPAWYELRVRREDGVMLWRQEAGLSHVGWVSVFACSVDGRDCLLRYIPWLSQRCAAYAYQLFTLDNAGEETMLRTNHVAFDLLFGSSNHQLFDAAEIAAFEEEVHGYMENGALLLTTQNANFRTGGSGAAFRDDLDFWSPECPYDESRSLAENLERLKLQE